MARQPPKPPKSLHQLVRDAFNTPLGRPALDELIKVYVHKDHFDKDSHKHAYRAGMAAVVLMLEYYTNSKPLETFDDGGNADDRDDFNSI